MKRQLWMAIVVVLGCAVSWGQAGHTAAGALVAKFAPGRSIRYEFEGVVHFTTDHDPGVKLNIAGDCSYGLHAVLKFGFEHAGSDGSLAGRVQFEAVKFAGRECATRPRPELVKALQSLEANGLEFQVNAAGDARLKRYEGSGLEYEGISLLHKAAWDLLQTRLSDTSVPATNWFATRRFLYWPDTFVENMDVAAASSQYARNVSIGEQNYAVLQFKQVFSPVDMPAYVEARTRARDFSGTTVVTGKSSVSLLFDRENQRIVQLHRERSIDNRMMLKYESSDQEVRVANYVIDEESTVRWLPEKNSEAWLAGLHKFESRAAPSTTAAVVQPMGQSLAALAATTRKRAEEHEHRELTDLLDRTPKGFERWRKNYCNGNYCFELSLAVPEGTKVADSTETTVLLLNRAGERTISLAVGPILDQQRAGLGDDELLQEQSQRFVANYLWFAAGNGHALNFERGSVQDRPAAFRDFTATGRDLKPIRGRLVMVISLYDRLVPIACSYPASEQESLDAVCQTVTSSIVIR